MRVIRRVVGVLLALVGLVVAVVGGAAAFWLIGPDNTVHSGEQHLSSKGLAIATTPELLNRNGPVLHVDVRSAKSQPVFVGVARDFDVSSYLKGVGHTKLVQVQYPIALSTEDEKGTAGPLTAPATLDWWVTKANGTGTQSISWPIEDGPYDVVIMNADGKTAPDVQADLGIEIPKAFTTALAILAVGLVLLALGILLILLRKRTPKPPTPWQPGTHPPLYGGQPTEPQRPAEPAGQQPPPRTGGGTARRLGPAGLVLALVSGCAAIPPADTEQTLTRPAISEQVAAGVIKHYDQVSNAAVKRRDDDLIATVETGDELRQSQAGFRVDRLLDKAGKDIPDATTHVKPSIGVPSYGGYPMHFVAASGMSAYKDYRVLDLWERKTAGSPWLVTAQVTPENKVKLPALKGLRPVTPADAGKLAATPDAAGKALAEYLTGGAKSPRAALFAPSTDVTDILNETAKTKADLLKDPKSYRSVTDTFTVTGTPRAFLTASGEALMFLSVTDEYEVKIGPNLSIYWGEGGAPSAFSPPTAKYDSALKCTILYQVALAIPAKGAKVRVLSTAHQVVDAGGY